MKNESKPSPRHRPLSYRKQTVAKIKKVALWYAYEDKHCPYCRLPMKYEDIWIEHIIPEKTLEDPMEWEKAKKEYGLGDNFEINDYENWLPVHWRCNLDRGKSIWELGDVRYYLMIAKRQINRAREEETKLKKGKKIGTILSALDVALEKGALLPEDILNFLRRRIKTSDVNEPVVMTFGVNTNDLMESDDLPDEASDLSYPELCDWLEEDLVKRLSSVLSCDFYYPEASARSGETLSVRLVFVDLDWDQFDKFDPGWWEILEVAYLSEIYPNEAG